MNNKTFNFIIDEINIGKRIDTFLSENIPELTRSRVQQLVADGFVFYNQKQVRKSCKLNVGDILSLEIPTPKEIQIQPQNIPINIVFEDDDIVIVNKPKGMVVHPAAGNPDNTLVNALLFHCKDKLSGINGELRPGIVHRIDKDTSGLLVIAKNDFSHNFLSEQLAAHTITREYHAIIHGVLKQETGTIEAPIGRHPVDRKKMAINHKNGKSAITHFTVLEHFNGFSYIKCNLETGRTHQIRVHMASIGHPIAGDLVYGPKKAVTELNGQCLHAKLLGFTHPKTMEQVLFTSELPDYFKIYLDKLKRMTY